MSHGEDKEELVDFWKSFEEYHQDSSPELETVTEFAEGTFDGMDLASMSSVNRRQFLALMGASAALAGTGCSDYRSKGVVIPYNKKPVEVVPGIANFYASSCTACPDRCGTLIKTREGRPIKVDGNPDHPINQGKICAKGQAQTLALYDPDRLRHPVDGNGAVVQWEFIDKDVVKALKQAQSKGQEIALILPKITSPALAHLLTKFSKSFPVTRTYSFDYYAEYPRVKAWEDGYGDSQLPVIAWDQAEIILALESDFLGKGKGRVETVRKYSQRRNGLDVDSFNRLYAVEGAMSSTGMSADHRIRLRPDLHLEFVFCLLNQLVVQEKVSQYAGYQSVIDKLGEYSLTSFASTHGIEIKVLNALVNDLKANLGKTLVHSGSSHSQELHQAVNFLNEVLSGTSLYQNVRHQNVLGLSSNADFKELIGRMESGKVGVVVHCDVNPAYHFAPDAGYQKALKNTPMVVSMVEVENETSKLSTYALPINHALESWGDAKVQDHVIGLQQPVIAPINHSRQLEGILLGWLEGKYSETGYQEFLKRDWKESVYPIIATGVDFETFWNNSLHDGFVKFNEKVPPRAPYALTHFLNIEPVKIDTKTFVIQFAENYTVGDGKLSNNGWLLELPHPVSKVVWDNYAAVSAGSAKALGLEQGSKIEIEIEGRKAVFPVFIQPGMADSAIQVELGYGRTHAGAVGTGVGHDAGKLLTEEREQGDWVFSSAIVKKYWGSYDIVSTQEHGGFNIGASPMLAKLTKDAHLRRGIVHQSTVHDYKANPSFVSSKMKDKRKHVKSLYTEEHKYAGMKWGMAIDLNRCTGCNECIVACSAENNVPVVGKEQVKRNREMHWIRIDRYYSGTIDEPITSLQPMLCQQCDNATCENVCPVAATTHSPDGLNGMAYNRCVGTRYCAANCPYKVRRFNFLNFRRHLSDSQYEKPVAILANNPEVTVRSRGVMEKCTFCVQRLREGRQIAIQDKREFKGTDVTTACQDACNANAIIFGDTNNAQDPLRKYQENDLEYKVLEELMIRPNITYLAKLRNTNEEGKS